jgi:hypothetical protein
MTVMRGTGRENGETGSDHILHRLHRPTYIAVDAGWMVAPQSFVGRRPDTRSFWTNVQEIVYR